MKTLLYVCASIALLCIGYAGIWMGNALRDLKSVTDAAAATLTGLNGTVSAIRVDLTDPKTGVLPEFHAAIREGRKTIDVIQKTSLAERSKVAQFSDASIRLVNDSDLVARNGATAVKSLQDAADSLGGASAALQVDARHAEPVIDGAVALLSTVDKCSSSALTRITSTIGDMDALIVSASPSVHHVDSAMGHIDDGSKSLAETLGYIRDDFKPRKSSFWVKLLDKATGGAVEVLLHLFVPQRVIVE